MPHEDNIPWSHIWIGRVLCVFAVACLIMSFYVEQKWLLDAILVSLAGISFATAVAITWSE